MSALSSLNLNHLYYFWLVATEGSVRKAAEKIHLTQPTLSDQIRTLEKRLGKDLFERKRNRLHLTKFGHRTYEHCAKMFDEGEKILFDIDSDLGELRYIKVGMVPELSKFMISKLLLPILNKKTSYLSIVEAEFKSLIKDLNDGKIDVILTTGLEQNLTGVFKQKIVQNTKFVAVSSKDWKGKKTFPQILEEIPYISYTHESHLFFQIQSYFKKAKLKINTICEVDDINLISRFTVGSDGFSILPISSVAEEIKRKKLFVLGEISSIKSELNIVYKDLKQNVKILEIFNDK